MDRATKGAAPARGNPRAKAPHGAFGSRLATFRAGAALTQSELAKQLGVSRRQIAYYESGHGRPPGALLGVLADLFKVSTDVLLGRELSGGPAIRLSGALLTRLKRIEAMGSGVIRRLEATLDGFIRAENRRRRAGPPRKARAKPTRR